MGKLHALYEDYMWDALLSFGDELLLVIGVDLDIGDVLAAVKTYQQEKKIVGGLWAIIPALEAANFIIGLVPYLGTPIEYVTNLIPAVTITRLFFSKYGPAKKKLKELREKIGIAAALGVDVSKDEVNVLNEGREMIDNRNPVGALKEEKSTIEKLKRRIKNIKSISGGG